MKSETPRKRGLKQRLIEALELPKEVALDMPKFTMVGNENLVVQNYKRINEYQKDMVVVTTSTGVIRISGDMLSINEITSEDLALEGQIKAVEFN